MREMTARYGGRCKGCGNQIVAGTQILWSKQTGALHNGACLDAYWGDEFGRHEAAQERAAYQREMDDEVYAFDGAHRADIEAEAQAEMEAEGRMIAREEAEYLQGRAQVAEIQALTTAGSALREALYLEMEQRDYDLYG